MKMNDLISRQAAIDAIKGLPHWIMDANGEFQSVDPSTVSMLDPDDAVAALENLPPEEMWVSCNDRLPEEKGEYLVTYHPCWWDQVGSSLEVGLDSFRGKTAWARKKFQRVVAWMKKPEPYEESVE